MIAIFYPLSSILSKFLDSATRQCFVHNLLRLAHNRIKVRFVLKVLRINFVDLLRARGSGREPTVVAATTFNPPMGAPLPGARVSLLEIGSPASVAAATASGESFSSLAFCSGVAGASMRM